MSDPAPAGSYLGDVLDQPRALHETERALEVPPALESIAVSVASGELTRVVMTGMGSSFHALHPLHLDLIEHGFTSIMVETSELIHHMPQLLNRRTLLIVVSQSGASVEILRLMSMVPDQMPIVGVTNTEGSVLASQATVSLFTRAGCEYTVSCKTYVTALLALSWLSAILTGSNRAAVRRELQQAAPLASRYLHVWQSRVEEWQTELKGIRSLFLVGRGASLAAVGVGGLIIKESAHVHAEGMSSAAFRHGPFEILGPETYVAVLLGQPRTSALNQRLYADVLAAGGRAARIAPGIDRPAFNLPDAPERVRPILEMLPIEMMSFALAALQGREAGKFALGSKITTVE